MVGDGQADGGEVEEGDKVKIGRRGECVSLIIWLRLVIVKVYNGVGVTTCGLIDFMCIRS